MTDVSVTIVDRLYRDYQGLRLFLDSSGESSHAQLMRDTFQRNLIVSAASLFEQFIKDAINEFSHHRSNGDAAIVRLIQVGVTDRGYHQMFEWDKNTATKFFGYFGKTSESLGFKMKEACASNKDLQASAKAFLELGRLRNNLVHNNFAFVSMDLTVEESYELFENSKPFVRYLLSRLDQQG